MTGKDFNDQVAAQARALALYSYIVSIIMGEPTGLTGAPINTASGVLLQLESGPVLATAKHVLEEYDHRCCEECVAFQAGGARIDLQDRAVWRHPKDDLAMIKLRVEDVEAIGTPVSKPFSWPPQIPPVGSLAIVTGLPRDARTSPSDTEVYFGPMVAQLPVLSAFENHFTCKLDRDQSRTILGRGVPDRSYDFRGMSGGPVFVETTCGYPVVGLVKEVKDDLEYFVVQGFRNSPLAL